MARNEYQQPPLDLFRGYSGVADQRVDRETYRAPRRFPGYGGCAGCGKPTMMLDVADRWCPPCRMAEGLPERTMGAYVPWYEALPPEEVARIRAKPWSGGRVRWDEASGVELPVDGLAAIFVAYSTPKGAELPMMVGKTFFHGQRPVFYHAFDDRKGNRRGHDNTNCPVPVDTVVVDWLLAVGIERVYAYDVGGQVLWRTTASALLRAPVATFAANTIRQRFYLDAADWEGSLTGVFTVPKDIAGTARPYKLVQQEEVGNREIMKVPHVAKDRELVLRNLIRE